MKEKDQQTYFTLPRKMVAAMTGESWEHIPHAVFTYEAGVERLLEVLQEHNKAHPDEHVTVNSAMLKLIAEALSAAPRMNGHIHYRRWMVSGSIRLFSNVDISVPVRFPGAFMVPVTIRGLEKKSMREIGACINDCIRRAAASNMEEVMYEVSIHDTLAELRHGHIIKAAGRLAGALVDRKHMRSLGPKERRAYRRGPKEGRLSWHDLQQGTISVSNIGSLYKGWKGQCTLLEIVPPQLSCIGLGAIRDGVLPMTIAFDHRALDADDVIPFMRKLDELLASEELLRKLL